MRLTRLDLLRFGKFTDKSIAMPHSASDFHLIVGPNEAGKSTLRNAIQDLLFGIETRSRYNFLHAHSEMRLGALIEHDGNQLDFIRTKARTKTLMLAGGAALPDQALTPFLGPIDRTFFDQMFGLNHDRLVKGGQEILSAANDVGQILFQAAAGIGSLGAIRDKLVQEADALWASRKSDKREYYLAAHELELAEAALKHSTVRTKDWQEASTAVDTIAAQLKTARDHYDQLTQARYQLERVRRIAPMLTTLDLVESQLDELGPVTALPDSASAQLAEAEHQVAIGGHSLHLFESQIADLNGRISLLHPDVSILARAADIEALSATRQQLRDVPNDIAKREGEVRVLWQDVQEATRQLGWPVEDEAAVGQRLPGNLVRAAIDSLVRSHEALVQALVTAQASCRSRQEEIRALDAEITSLPVADLPVALIDALACARALGDVLAQQKRLDGQSGRLKRDLDSAALELGHWNPGLEALRALLPPTQDETNVLIKRRSEMALTAATLGARLAEVAAEVQNLQLEITQYKATHHPVTLDDVTQGRARRDAAWHVIRGGTVTLTEAGASYEQTVTQADALSDQRHDKAQEETELQARLDRLQRLQSQSAGLAALVQVAAQELIQLDQAWDERLVALGLPDMPLLRVNQWRSARDRVVSAADGLAEALSAQQDFGQTVLEARAGLVQAMQALKPEAASSEVKLSVLTLMADEVVTATNRAQERRSTLASQRARAEFALPDLVDRAAQAQAALDDWQADWQKNLALAHLPTDAAIAAVAGALALFDRMHQQLQKIRETRVTRIDLMRRDLGSFAAAATALATRIAPELSAAPASDISMRLDEQLRQHAASARDLVRLQQDRDQLGAQSQAASDRMAASSASLAPLLRLAGVRSNDELRQAAGRSDRHRALSAERQLAHRQLLNAGDGLDREALADELAATNADAVAARLSDNMRQTEEAVDLQNRLSSDLTSAQTVLGKIAGQGEAARAESQRQEALARMGNAVERFIKVYTAAKLLRWAIEKFRESKQGPMLARASDIFAGLTQGAFSKLVVDYDCEPLQLSAQRSGGPMVEVDGMSEGTRDQLYLALRLAALELHLAQTVPLPFIADDLFINYDDGRARAGLQALARLSESTQVIFLSHHAHLVPVAREVFGDQLNVVMLDAATTA